MVRAIRALLVGLLLCISCHEAVSTGVDHSATIAGLRASFGVRHLSNVSCTYVVPEIDGKGPLSSAHPRIVQQLNRGCAKLHVTRYATEWNLGWFFLTEAAAGRLYGGKVLEISGRSSMRQYLLKPNTVFVEAIYPEVDVVALDKKYAEASFDMVIAESVLEHVASPFLAVLQMHRVLREGGHMLLMMPSTYPYHFGPFDFWRVTPDSLKVLAAPFSRVAMCGCHRSSSLAALLASPDAKKAIKIYPAQDARARRMVLEPVRKRSASRPRWGWDGDRTAPSGEPKYGEAILSSWIMAAK